MKILNLTQHPASPEQIREGVIEPPPELKNRVKALLTFEEIPSPESITSAADSLAELVIEEGCSAAMIGGAPFLMGALERALRKRGLIPFYAFSKRESVERVLEDGSVEKRNIFQHLGFVTPPL